MKKFVLIVVAALAVIGTPDLLRFAPEEADASSAPSNPGASVGATMESPVMLSPPWYEPDSFYYKFGPYTFPPVLRVYEPPAAESDQPTAPPPWVAPVEQQKYRYFCEHTKTYYPQVQTCATPWQRRPREP